MTTAPTAPGPTSPSVGSPPAGPAPRFSRRWALVTVGVLLSVTGALVGVVWARFAPPVHGVVGLTHGGNRVRGYLGDEADNFFVAAALMLGLLSVVAVVAAVWAWQWRAHRGPGMAAALAMGNVAAAALAVTTGALLMRSRYGPIDVDAAPVTPADRVWYFTEAPAVFFGQLPLQIAATLGLPAAAAALIYAVCAAATVRDDLGGYPPEPVPPVITAAGGAPHAR